MGNNTYNKKIHNKRYDYIKAVACIFVILIHCKFPGKTGDIFEALARFSVPIFFAVAGTYLLGIGEKGQDRKNLLRKLKKTAKVTLKVYMIYTIYSFLYAMSVGYSAANWFTEKYNAFEFSRLLLFNSGKFIYDFTYAFDHMWYLFALIYVYGLCYIFAGVLRSWAKPLSIILTGFLFFGELLQIYYPIRPFGISVSVWYVIRNWLFVGIPFTMLGFWMKEEKVSQRLKRPVFTGGILAAAGVISTVVEYNIWGGREVYLGSLLIVIGLIILANDGEDNKLNSEKVMINSENKPLTAIEFLGRELSSSIYFYHVMVISFFGWCIDRIYPDAYANMFFMFMRPIAVICITILISLLIYKVKFITTKSEENLRK